MVPSRKRAYPRYRLFLEIAGSFDSEDGADIMDPLERCGIRIQYTRIKRFKGQRTVNSRHRQNANTVAKVEQMSRKMERTA